MAKSKWLAFVGALLLGLAYVGAHTKEPPYQPPQTKGPTFEEMMKHTLPTRRAQ